MSARPAPTRIAACGLIAVTSWGVVACSEQVDSPASGADATTTPSSTAASPTSEPVRPPGTSADTTTRADATTTATTTIVTTTTAAITTTTTTPPEIGGFVCPGAESSSIWFERPPSDLAAPPLPPGWGTEVVGSSVQGRDIVAHVRAVAAPRRTVVVIGGVHGNEPVSPPAVRGMATGDYPADVELWLVPAMNPDGSAAGLRCNANGVDLNRNFPWGWLASDGGPAALSEPESAAMVELVRRLDPDLVVWVHQPYGYVSSIGATADALEQAWSAGSGLPVRPDVSQHGGGESWTALEHGASAMLIEIDTWEATPAMVDAQRAGLEATVAALG